MPPGQVIWFIIGTVIILFGAYYVTYFIGTKASGQTFSGMRNRNINVLDRFAVSRDKCFYIIEVADKVYFVGVANNGMTLFDTYGRDEFAGLTAREGGVAPVAWADTPVGRYGNRLTKSVVAFVAKKMGKTPEDNTESKTDFSESMKEAAEKADKDTDDNDPADCGWQAVTENKQQEEVD